VDIDISKVTLPGQAIGIFRAAIVARDHGEVTALVIRDLPVAEIVPVNRSVYTALLDSPGRKSAHIGVFSSEELARAACQEHKDEDDEEGGQPKSALAWAEDTAELPDGDSYVVVLTSLDIRTGQG
jgi:hypothetical protein